MHHLFVKNNLVEGKPSKLGYGGGEQNDLPVCPKPRRPRLTISRELVKPFKCTSVQSCSQTNVDGRSEILNMMITDKKTVEEREPVCYYTGSPPQRTGNPLIHDVHFVNQVELFPPLASLKN